MSESDETCGYRQTKKSKKKILKMRKLTPHPKKFKLEQSKTVRSDADDDHREEGSQEATPHVQEDKCSKTTNISKSILPIRLNFDDSSSDVENNFEERLNECPESLKRKSNSAAQKNVNFLRKRKRVLNNGTRRTAKRGAQSTHVEIREQIWEKKVILGISPSSSEKQNSAFTVTESNDVRLTRRRRRSFETSYSACNIFDGYSESDQFSESSESSFVINESRKMKYLKKRDCIELENAKEIKHNENTEKLENNSKQKGELWPRSKKKMRGTKRSLNDTQLPIKEEISSNKQLRKRFKRKQVKQNKVNDGNKIKYAELEFEHGKDKSEDELDNAVDTSSCSSRIHSNSCEKEANRSEGPETETLPHGSNYINQIDRDTPSRVTVHKVGNRKLIIIGGGTQVYIIGAFHVKVISGTVDVYGYSLNASDKEVDLYSVKACAYIPVINSMKGNNLTLYDDLLASGLNDYSIKNICKNSPSCAVVSCTRITNKMTKLLKKHIEHEIVTEVKDDAIELMFERDPLKSRRFSKSLKISSEWDSLLEVVNNDSRIMLCGGKGVGKSMALRYLVNKLLTLHATVLVIDLDPGQPEFTVPGCISAILVNEPILGPSYTHLRKPDRCVNFIATFNLLFFYNYCIYIIH